MEQPRIVDRKELMSPNGRLELVLQGDGDIVIAVYPDTDNGDSLGDVMLPMASIEFCTPFSGGGGSPRTHKALRALFEAMVQDNYDDRWNHRRGEHPGKPEWIAR